MKRRQKKSSPVARGSGNICVDLGLPETEFLQGFQGFITKHYGPRCPEPCAGCKVCQMWAIYDVFALQIE